MKFLKKVLITLVVLAIVIGIVGLFLPSQVHVQRSTTIAAAPAKLFNFLNTFENFNQWSPWYERDPDAEYRIEGPASGVGAKMSWSSEQADVGSGSQEIVFAEPDRLIRTQLDFGAQGLATAALELVPAGDSTQVTWSLDTEFGYDIIGRYFGLMFDQWIGTDYEKGLSKLKQVIEAQP